LDALRQMTSIPDRRVAFRAVDWAFYEQLVDSIPESVTIHVDYDGKDLEIMGTGPKHERIKELLSYLVRILCEELGIACKGLGETTWKRPEVARGLEADLCYYFRPEKLAAAQAAQLMDSDDIADYPNPDPRSRSTSRPR
jgi:Uma2 family endonuclease